MTENSTSLKPFVIAVPGEDLAVTLHGRAEWVPLGSPDCRALRQAMLDEYLPKQGPAFEEWIGQADAVGVRIAPDRVFTFSLAG